jgi:hypothetical protein
MQYIESIESNHHFSSDQFIASLAAQEEKVAACSCPSGCGHLRSASAGDIIVDWCPSCDGVWFDRGEIDKLLSNHPRKDTKVFKPNKWDLLDLFILLP